MAKTNKNSRIAKAFFTSESLNKSLKNKNKAIGKAIEHSKPNTTGNSNTTRSMSVHKKIGS